MTMTHRSTRLRPPVGHDDVGSEHSADLVNGRPQLISDRQKQRGIASGVFYPELGVDILRLMPGRNGFACQPCRRRHRNVPVLVIIGSPGAAWSRARCATSGEFSGMFGTRFTSSVAL